MKKNILNLKYEILKTLGSGGMSTVYLCQDIKSKEKCAVKVMKQHINNSSLEAEWYILKTLQHRGIPKAVEFFVEDENLYLVEEYIEGSTLEHIIEKDLEISNDKFISIFFQLCDIVSYLHSLNPPIIYRDMKPSNIMITPTNDVVLLDFGISRLYKEDKTTDTVFMGSKGYAAPEQYGLSQSERATDIYGVGAVLFFMVVCHAPTNIMEPLKEESYKATTPKNLIKIIQKAMQVDITKRFSSIEEFRSEMHNYVNNYAEENIDSTTVLGGIDKTQLLDNSLNENSKNKVKLFRRFNSKKAILILGILIFTFISIRFLLSYFHKTPDSSSTQATIKETPTPTPTQTGEQKKVPEAQVEKVKKDEIIEGVLKKSSPTRIADLKDNGDSKDKGKSWNKNKNKKKDEDKDENDKIISYDLITAAEVTKNEDFTIKLTRLDFSKDYIAAYCYIENNTNLNLSLNYSNNTYLFTQNGEKSLPMSSISTDLSNIRSKTKLSNIVIYFKKLDIDEGKLILRTYINFNDKTYNNDINLSVNVQ